MSDIPEAIMADMAAAELDGVEFEFVDIEIDEDGNEVIMEPDRESSLAESQEEEEEQDQKSAEKKKKCCYKTPVRCTMPSVRCGVRCEVAHCIITTSLSILFLLLLISTLVVYSGPESILPSTPSPTFVRTEAPSVAPTAMWTRSPRASPSAAPSAVPTVTPSRSKPPTAGR
jgi:hypothetical protein